ncbi:MAG: class II fructose-bisphosphate aldolase [Calditrichaeota bacterium]|nr:class II fructose-bisphosphate aldolase [Calditrichota bacterium]
MKISLAELFQKNYGVYGIPAFNVFNAEQVLGVFRGAIKAELPIITAITPAARKYITHEVLEGIITSAAKLYPSVTFSVHLDHGNVEHCISAIDSGFYDSIMIDASHEEFSKNVEITSEIVKKAHDKDITVEAELGVLSGVEDDISVSEKSSKYTDPDQVHEFVERTKCDSLAVAVGTSHGAYKLSAGQGLQLDILKRIREILPGFPIVLHGASNVSREEITRINDAGGNLKSSAKGIDPEEIKQAIKLGVTKINVATDLRLLWTRIHREFFRDTPDLFDMVVPGRKYMEELSEFVNQKCRSLYVK